MHNRPALPGVHARLGHAYVLCNPLCCTHWCLPLAQDQVLQATSRANGIVQQALMFIR